MTTFSVNVAADVFGRKVNLSLPFPQRPSFIELQRSIESAFGTEMQLSNNSSNGGGGSSSSALTTENSKFEISAIQIYNDGNINGVGAGWDILRSCATLTSGCQLYAFQRSVAESSFDIPSPRAPRGNVGMALNNAGNGSAAVAGRGLGGDLSAAAAAAIGNGSSALINNRRGSNVSAADIERSNSVAAALSAHHHHSNNNGAMMHNAAAGDNESTTAGDEILAHHIQRRGTSPPRPSGIVNGPIASGATLLRAAAPPTNTQLSYESVVAAGVTPVSAARNHRSISGAASTVGALSESAPYAGAHNGTTSSAAAGAQQQQLSAIDVLNATTAEMSPTAVSSLVTMKQKLFADPNPSIDHKVRTVFDELDGNHNRRIEIGEFRQTLFDMRITLPESEVKDIFIRSDKDHSGTISFAEFEWMAMHYPTLVDALYFRLKEAYEERRKRDVIEARRRAVDEELQRQAAETIRIGDIRRRIDEFESQLLNLEQERKTKEFRERECQQKLAEAKREVESQRQLRQQREGDVASAKENERQRHATLLEAQKTVESAQRKVSEMESELARAQEKESQLEKLLEAARKETDRARKTLQNGVEEARNWRDHEAKQSELFNESQKEVQKCTAYVSNADQELENLIAFATGAEEQLLSAQRETALAAHRREQQQAMLTAQQDKDAEHQHLIHSVNIALEKARNALDAADRDLADFRQRRLRIEAQEKPLIEQEVALRTQRFALEEQETVHRYEKVSFYNSTGRPAVEAGNTSSAAMGSSPYVGGGHSSVARSHYNANLQQQQGALNASAAAHQVLMNTTVNGPLPPPAAPTMTGAGPLNASSFPLASPAPQPAASNNSYMQQQFYRGASGARY